MRPQPANLAPEPSLKLRSSGARLWAKASAGPGYFDTAPKLATSNTRLLLDAVFHDSSTGESVALSGLVHVQTKVRARKGTLAVHANIEDAFLGYSTLDVVPGDVRLNRLTFVQQVLKKEAEDLTSRLGDALSQGDALQKRIQDALASSTCPPGVACERTVSFDLIRADGGRTSFEVRLNLRFSSSGRVVPSDAVLAEEPPCGVDAC